MGLLRFAFSFSGRINRAKFWLGQLLQLVLIALGVAIASGAQGLAGTSDRDVSPAVLALFYVLMVAWFWMSLAITAKRFHDRNQSGWWQLVGLIPFGGLYVLIVCGFLRGDEGPNDFGPDPLQRSDAGSLPPSAISKTA